MTLNFRQLSATAGFAAFGTLGVTVLVYFAGILPSGSALVRNLDHLISPGSQRIVSVAGQVTYRDRDHGILFLQSPESAWRIETSEIDKIIRPGSFIEATGIVNEEFGSTFIQSAKLRFLRPSSPAKPVSVSASGLSDAGFSNRLVAVTGIVLDANAERLGQLDLTLQVDGQRIKARVADWTASAAHLTGAKVTADCILDRATVACLRADCSTLMLSGESSLHLLQSERLVSPDEKAAVDRPPLTRVADIHRLPANEARRHLPVRLTGVVTITKGIYLFLQDETGGVYVDGANGAIRQPQTGQRVVLTGRTGSGQFAPVVVQPHIEAITPGTLPVAVQPDLATVLSGSEDSNWIEMEGVVRAVSWERNLVYLSAETNGVPFQIAVVGARELPKHLIDAKVRLRGVCATQFNRLRQLVGFYIMTPSLDFIHVEEPPVDPATLTLRPISEFGSFSPNLLPGHRERVQGIVTFRSSSLTYVQDRTGSLEVKSTGALGEVKVGDRVEAVGFSAPRAFGPVMLDGSIQKVGGTGTVRPRHVTAEDILNQGAEGELVSLEATLSDRVPLAGGEMLFMHSGRIAFPVRLDHEHAPAARPGSVLRLVGIPSLQARPGHPYVPNTFSLLIGSAQNVQVVRQAHWWNARLVLWVVGLAGFVSALVSFWAVTLRRQVRRQTSVIQTQLTEAQELRAQAESAARVKSEFLANMSHEIRTPLNGIIGMTDLALTENINPAVRDYLETAQLSGATLLQVINDVLDLSKIEAGHMRIEAIPFDLKVTVRDAAAILRPTAVIKSLAIDVLYPESLPRWFLGDPLRIRQVLINLLGNAVKFTEIGGATVEIHCHELQSGTAQVRVEVRDTGIGIPSEKQADLFQSFTQADASTSRKHGGTGLGLAISKHLVNLMGGAIGFSSHYGRGSAFWFEFPLTLADAAAGSARTLQPLARALQSTGRILLAEDNLVNQKLATRLLERLGFTVHSVLDGTAAIASVRDSRFDLILMDCQMPGCDGYEATAEIRRWEIANGETRTPIVALTAHALPGDRERCLESGMDDYLTKPLRSEELRAALDQWIPQAGHHVLQTPILCSPEICAVPEKAR